MWMTTMLPKLNNKLLSAQLHGGIVLLFFSYLTWRWVESLLSYNPNPELQGLIGTFGYPIKTLEFFVVSSLAGFVVGALVYDQRIIIRTGYYCSTVILLLQILL